MSIDTGRPLAEIVNRSRGSARVLESFGLDYCCGGSRSLIDACAVVGADPSEVLVELDRLDAEPPPEWTSMGVAELVDHIERTHHEYLHGELPRLGALAQKVAGVHGGSHPELMDLLADIAELRDDLEPHLAKEEAVLFPILRQLDEAGPAATALAPSRPIAMMIAEHDVTGALLERIRARTDGFAVPPDACTSYRQLYLGLADLEADTHLHVHKENNLLFPAVLGESGVGHERPPPTRRRRPPEDGSDPAHGRRRRAHLRDRCPEFVVTARDLGDEGGDPPCWAHLDPHGEQARADAVGPPEGLADAVVVADTEGRITHWNDAATLLFGRSPALGESLDVIIPERFRERHWAGYRRAMSTGRTQHGDDLLHVPALHADGSWISVEFTVALLHDEQHHVEGIAASLRRDPSRQASRSSHGDPEQP